MRQKQNKVDGVEHCLLVYSWKYEHLLFSFSFPSERKAVNRYSQKIYGVKYGGQDHWQVVWYWYLYPFHYTRQWVTIQNDFWHYIIWSTWSVTRDWRCERAEFPTILLKSLSAKKICLVKYCAASVVRFCLWLQSIAMLEMCFHKLSGSVCVV